MRNSNMIRTLLICMSCLVIVQCAPYVPPSAVDIPHRRMLATAVQEFEFLTGKYVFRELVLPAEVVFAGDHITIATPEPQHYSLISEATIEDNLWGWSMTWAAIDNAGHSVNITFGILRQQSDVQLRIKYWDHKTTYRLQREAR